MIFFSHASGVRKIKRILEDNELVEFSHEVFIEDPERYLAKFCESFGVVASEDYLNECEEFVFDSPSRSREHADWSEEAKAEVAARVSEFDWLEDYRFD